MNRAMLLREKIGKLPLILAHTGVTITQEGASAYVRCDSTGKPTAVNLPYIADNATDELMDAIEGFLDHEVAHLLFTDFNLTQQSKREGFGALHGLLEDTCVETQMAQKFPGTRANLSETGRFYLRRAVEPALQPPLASQDLTTAQGILMAPALRAWAGQLVYEDFMREYWPVMKDVRAALGPLVNEIEYCRNTADTYALARKMADALRAYDPSMMPPPATGGEGEASGAGQAESGQTGEPQAQDASQPPENSPAGQPQGSRTDQQEQDATGQQAADGASPPAEDLQAGQPESGEAGQQAGSSGANQQAGSSEAGQQAGSSEAGQQASGSEAGQQAGDSQAGQQTGSSGAGQSSSGGTGEPAGEAAAGQKTAGAGNDGQPSAEAAAGGDLSALDAAPKFDDLLAGGDTQQESGTAGDSGQAGAEGAEDSAKSGQDGVEGAEDGAKGRQGGAVGEAYGEGELGEARKSSTHGGFYREVDKLMRNSFDEKLLQLIEKQAVAANRGSEYRVFSTENDRVEPLPVPTNEDISGLISQLESKVAHLCGPMQKNLERLIVARSLATWQPAQRSGRLHSASLARLACNDGRVFRKKIEGKSRDVALELVIDCSGSMGGARINLATQAAYALSTVLTRLNIAHEVIGFTTCGSGMRSERAYAKELRKHAWQYARVEALYMPIIKGYNERMTADVRSRFGWLPHSGILNNNVDGECVDIAARRLAKRPEKTKMMLVLSDGVPAAYGDCDALRVHLKKVVKQIEASGIKVVGLGIQTDAVASFYTRHLVVRRLSDLPTTVLKELKALVVDN